jgi:hypothetical protein
LRLGPNWFSFARNRSGDVSNGARRACVGFPGSLGVVAQQRRRIMPAAGGNNVHGYAIVQQHGFVRAPGIMKPQLLEPKLARLAVKFLGRVAEVAWLRKRRGPDLKEIFAEHSLPAEPDWASMPDRQIQEIAASFSECKK